MSEPTSAERAVRLVEAAPASALVVVAHPDDAEFGAAGTLARWVRAGSEVSYLVLTDGASGSPDPTMTRARLRHVREQEQRAACEHVGAGGVRFLGEPDGHLRASTGLLRHVAAEVRRLRPEVLVTLDPTVRYRADGFINHPDHRVAGDMVLDSVNPAASSRLWDPSLLREGLEPWDVAEVWMVGFGEGDTVVDVTATFEAKVAALRSHASQLREWDPEPLLRDWAEAAGAAAGVPLGERFTVLRLREPEPADGSGAGG